MSGSKSSAGDVEALSFTVHQPPQPSLAAAPRRTANGRLKMLLVLLVCAAPVVGSYLAYFVFKPQARSNYGSLITPTRTLPDITLRTLAGQALPAGALKGQWLLLVVGPAACDAACEKRLFTQRQLREMLGRERDRLDKIWLITDGAMPTPALRAAAEAAPALTILQADGAAVARWLAPEAGHALEEHLYVVDPMGEWMMRMPANAEPARVKRDLDRLLRASGSWDLPGR